MLELDYFIGKLAKWAFIFHESNFDKVHKANKSNMDVNGWNLNLKSNEEDTIGVHWHGNIDLKKVPRWHAFVYLCTLLICFKDVY